MSATSECEALAVSSAAVAAPESREFLTFRLGSEEYGIDILRVQEIRGYETPTRLAGAPHFVRGVLNLRGVIVPVVDLRSRFGTEAAFDALTVTIVMNVFDRIVGAVVDAVSDVLELSPEHIKPAPTFNTTFDTRHITGIGSVTQDGRHRMLVLLDIERLMGSDDMGIGNEFSSSTRTTTS